MTSAAEQTRLERRLLAALFLLLGLFYAWLLLSRRLPRGHDSLFVYVLQYLFLAQSAQGGGLPLWMPYATHGCLTSWYVGLEGGFLQNALLFLGGAPEGTNALPLFHLGMLFDEVLLLVGTWRLGRFFYRSPLARFFVTASLVGSTFWGEQMWHNHRALYAIPLILSFFHQYLGDGSRRSLFLGLNLLLLQFIGSLPYVAIMTGLVTGTYLTVYVVLFRRSLRPLWPKLRPRPVDALVLLSNLAILGAVYFTLTAGTREYAFQQEGRRPDGTVSPDQFLTFAGTLDPIRFVDLLLGVSPFRDFTLYCGVAAVPFAILAFLLRPGRKVFHFAVCSVLVFLLSLGYLSIVGMIAYHSLPPTHFYRYISGVGAHLRLPLLFLAGFGIEGLLRSRPADRPALRKLSWGLGLLALVCGLLALSYARNQEPPLDLPGLVRTPTPLLATFTYFDDPRILAQVFGGTCLAALAVAAVLLARSERPHWSPALVLGLFLVLHTGDLTRWRVVMIRNRTLPMNDEQYALQQIRPLPWIARRSAEPPDNRRARALAASLFEDGAVYDWTENYFHRDPPASRYTSSFWMSSVDQLLHAYARQPLDRSIPIRPAVLRSNERLRPPYDKLIGQSLDKIQVFAGVHTVESDALTAEMMNDPEFRGDVLMIAPRKEGWKTYFVYPPGWLKADERLAFDYEVLSFDANALRLKVTLPAQRQGAWLLYCDAWHPDWTAEVNGKDVAVARAFLAYKAVRLDAGTNVVEFRMRSPARIWTFRLAAGNATLWVFGVIALAAGCFRKGARAGT
jgi:hypothetical protein